MTKKRIAQSKPRPADVSDPTISELFVFGIDDQGKPRGARFLQAHEETVRATNDLGCRTVVKPPALFAQMGMQLPLGRMYASGKALLPNISQDLFQNLTEAEKLIAQHSDAVAVGVDPQTLNNVVAIPDDKEMVPLSTYPERPQDWNAIDVGHLVLIHGGSDFGWWPAVVTERNQNILKLRLRDYPKQGLFVRHRWAVGIINPGRALPRLESIASGQSQ